MHVALFGGTFDPVHLGHMAVARAALADRELALDRIYFVPADVPPHKQDHPVISYAHRYAMLELALEDEREMSVSEIELRAPGQREPNYSIETVRRFRETMSPEDELYFLIGSDAFRNLATWRQPLDLLRECRFVVVSRPGFTLADAMAALPPAAPREHIYRLDKVECPVSSSATRTAIAKRQPLEPFLPPAVIAYVREHDLYA